MSISQIAEVMEASREMKPVVPGDKTTFMPVLNVETLKDKLTSWSLE